MTFADTRNATSSQESEDGATPCGSRVGPITDLFGQEVVHVSRSAVRALEGPRGMKTVAISGLFGRGSLLQANLERSLANKCLTLGAGSMLSAMTWKHWVTQSGRVFSRLAVSVSTMRAIGFTLQATPTCTANQDAPSMMKHRGCKDIEVSTRSWRSRMGYPVEWEQCEPTEMPSSRKSRQRS